MNDDTGGLLNNFENLQITIQIKDTGSPLPGGGGSCILLNVDELRLWVGGRLVWRCS